MIQQQNRYLQLFTCSEIAVEAKKYKNWNFSVQSEENEESNELRKKNHMRYGSQDRQQKANKSKTITTLCLRSRARETEFHAKLWILKA